MRPGPIAQRIALSLAFLFSCSAPCLADALILKSGEILRGKLIEKKESSYVFLPSGGEKTEIPADNVSIADIDPASEAMPKGTVSVFTGVEGEGGQNEDPSGPLAYSTAPTSIGGDDASGKKGYGDVLKNASDTVALSNARTQQMIEFAEEAKKIADEAHQ